MRSKAELEQHAKSLDLGDVGHLDEADIIHAIQIKEGYQPCFGFGWCNRCDEGECLWKDKCIDETGQTDPSVISQ